MLDKIVMYNVFYVVVECNDSNLDGLCCNLDVYLKDVLFDIEEDIIVLYVMVKFVIDGLCGNIGLCYVEIDLMLKGFDLNSGEVVVYDGDYNEWLFSVNIVYDLFEDVVLCFVVL